MAARPGFEPRLTEPESVVLPLHHRAVFLSATTLRYSTERESQLMSALFYAFLNIKAPFFSLSTHSTPNAHDAWPIHAQPASRKTIQKMSEAASEKARLP